MSRTKKITLDGQLYLVSAPRLYNGGPLHTCDAYTTKQVRDFKGNRRTFPNYPVKSLTKLDRLAKAFLGIDL